MLKSLSLENFTVFSSAQFEFSPGINVIVGENGTGKTHLLKAAYCLNRAWPDLMLNRSVLSRKRAEVYFEERLLNLFQPDHLAKLVRRNKQRSKLKSEVTAFIPTILIATENERRELSKQFPFGSLTESLLWELIVQSGEEIELATNASLDASIIPETAAVNSFVPKSIFLPSKEIVSFYEGLSGLLEQYKIKLDATYKDMARNFDFPELNNPPNLDIISEIEDKLGGYLALEGRRLIFVEKDGNKLETPLLAEGVRKLAILPYFIRHGLIQMKGETLFWDEPETNLNPRLISKLAEALIVLAREGVQIILATHSLFLLKEIDLQLQLAGETSKVPSRFFALSFGDDGVQVSSGNNLVDIDPITALDVEIDQSDRYNEWYYRASRAK